MPIFRVNTRSPVTKMLLKEPRNTPSEENRRVQATKHFNTSEGKSPTSIEIGK